MFLLFQLRIRICLKDYYKDDVRQLSELLGRDLNYWTK